jgi:ribonuclease HII
VILPPDPQALAPLLGRCDDSKALTAKQREALYDEILAVALAAAVGRCEACDIDAWGIAPATRQAMAHALAGLACRPDFLLLDYLTLAEAPCPQRGIPHGDALSLSIAAASIIAKVTRDRWMRAQETAFPGYGLAQHKGYATLAHREAIVRLGPCAIHRMSFAPLNGAATLFDEGLAAEEAE